MNHDDFATFDAAYVLGALSPAERHAYEQHLAECDACSAAVRELAGMPGLLASVPLSAIEPDVAADEPAPEVLPRLLKRVNADRRRRTWWLSGMSTAAAILAVLLMVVFVFGPPGQQESPVRAGGQEMAPIAANTQIRATVRLTDVRWGTRLDLRCSKGTGKKYSGYYVLTVTDRKGAVEQVGSWSAVPGVDTTTVSAATGMAPDDIVSVDVRYGSPTGPILLSLTPR